MTVRSYRPLRPGERVAIVAASSPIRSEMLARGVDEVRALGFEPVVEAGIDARERFSAGSDARRADALGWAMGQSDLRAIWLARGGHGLSPVLRLLDGATFQADPKPIIGESDGTALGCWALSQGHAWVHGPMVASSLRLGDAGRDRTSLLAALTQPHEVVLEPEARTLAAGRATGRTWGGCLSLVAALAGTPWLPRVRPGLLLLEDVGVKPYQVHRMLVQLRDAGALEGVRGVILGEFPNSLQHPEQGYSLDDVLLDFFRETLGDVPVTAGWPVGHVEAPHLSVPMGLPAVLEVETSGRCSLRTMGEEEGA